MRKSIHRVGHGWLSHTVVRAGLLCGLGWSAMAVAVGQEPPPEATPALPELTRIDVTSTLDQESQPVLFWAPESANDKPTPMLVFLHSWSSDYRQANGKWQAEADRRGWIYLHPDFRGANRSPKACGSRFARQDVLDAMDEMTSRFKVDPERIYLAGTSGGGHMAMLMAGHHPDRFSAVSAWVGISDLAQWYRFHLIDGEPQRYAEMILACLGGPPGESRQRDRDYRDRSPRFHLHRATDVPLDIFAGVNDGHTGSVPVRHSLDAFNVVAEANGDRPIAPDEIEQLTDDRRLMSPLPSDEQVDDDLGREIRLRRESGQARVTIFDGGHESIPRPACQWLSEQSRATLVEKR